MSEATFSVTQFFADLNRTYEVEGLRAAVWDLCVKLRTDPKTRKVITHSHQYLEFVNKPDVYKFMIDGEFDVMKEHLPTTVIE